MPTNDFLAFATGGNANVTTQAAWAADPTVANGFYGGIAPSAKFNKAWRQATFPGASVSQWVLEQIDVDIPDDGNVQNWVDNFDAALVNLIQSLTRRRLTAPLTLYVSPSGSDANDGLTPTTPFQTPQHAYNFLMQNIDLGGFNVSIMLAPGQYSAFACNGQPIGGPAGIWFIGDQANPPNVTISAPNGNAVVATGSATFGIAGVRVQATGISVDYNYIGCGLLAVDGNIVFQNVDFGTCTAQHIAAINGGISANGGVTYSISGSANTHAFSSGGLGYIALADSIVSLYNTPNFPAGFVYAAGASTQSNWSMTFSGAATGPTALVTTNAILNINGANVNSYFPGNVGASVTTGGQVT